MWQHTSQRAVLTRQTEHWSAARTTAGPKCPEESAQEYDGAEPAASSIAAANLFRLAALSSTGDGARWPVC